MRPGRLEVAFEDQHTVTLEERYTGSQPLALLWSTVALMPRDLSAATVMSAAVRDGRVVSSTMRSWSRRSTPTGLAFLRPIRIAGH